MFYGTFSSTFFRLGTKLDVAWDFSWFYVSQIYIEFTYEKPDLAIRFGGKARVTGGLADFVGELEIKVQAEVGLTKGVPFIGIMVHIKDWHSPMGDKFLSV